MADKIDPFDVAALEKSLNDSATRVSTIWASFLIFSLYLLHDLTNIVRGGETNYVMATLNLFLSVYNIFISLLNLLLIFSGQRD